MAAIDVPLTIDETTTTSTSAPRTKSPQQDPKTILKPLQHQPIPISPSRGPYNNAAAASSPGFLRSPSPRMHSPASSEIFERNVQEPVPMTTLAGEPSAHLPAHVMTEDHIPPALEASAQAITSQELNADEVEIVTSTSHQPAATALEAGSTSQLDVSSIASPHSSQRAEDNESHISQSGLLPSAVEDEPGTTYGSIDPNDVRRLSFISFADVVQSEHNHPAAPMLNDSNSNSPPLSSSIPRTQPQFTSASPLQTARSPASSISQPTGVATPPLVAARAIITSEASPIRSGASAVSQTGTVGELTVETLRQAVRKTASGDIGQSFRSPAMSPISSNPDDQTANGNKTTT